MGGSPKRTAVEDENETAGPPASAPRPSGPGTGRLAAVLRSRLALAYAMGPLCLIPIWVLREMHLAARLPLWGYALALMGPSVTVATATNLLYARRPSRLALHARAISDSISTTVVIYATGWGPELGLVYMVAAQHLVASVGSKAWRPSRLWTGVGVVCGQVGIALGWVPSFVRSPVDNGAAFLGLLAFFLVSRMALAISREREQTEAEMRANEERFRSLVQNSSDMIIVLDEVGRAVYVGGACERMLGISAQEVLSADLIALMHPDELDAVRDCLSAAIMRKEPTRPIEMRARHVDGQWRHLELVGTNLRDHPAVAGVVLNVRDVTDRRRIEAELQYQATHDSLTGLPNRFLFLERLGESLARHQASPRRPAVLFLDVDRFKLINDSLGHEVGDQLLVEASRRLRATVRPTDTVARFGGDEFVVLCGPEADALQLAERLLSTFDEPFRLGGQSFFLSASIGVATAETADSQPTDLIRDADTAMYRAKEMGRGRLAVFDEAARAAAVTRVHTEHLLRGAAERGELRLYYQPVVELRTGAVVGVEALLRWHHPQLGLIGPADFIDAAEESGLIVPIGDWVLETACQQARLWARRGHPIDMAVNVSARQLADDDFLSAVSEIVEPVRLLTGAGPQITLEITERVLIREPESVGARLEQLKAIGLKLSMDDFGTGYSSLSNLRRYPFDSLKIDQRFVSGVTERDDDGTIVRAIIALAHGLGKTVVAEGVETADQLAALGELGCDLAQGYYVGEPRTATPLPTDLVLRHHDRSILSPAG